MIGSERTSWAQIRALASVAPAYLEGALAWSMPGAMYAVFAVVAVASMNALSLGYLGLAVFLMESEGGKRRAARAANAGGVRKSAQVWKNVAAGWFAALVFQYLVALGAPPTSTDASPPPRPPPPPPAAPPPLRPRRRPRAAARRAPPPAPPPRPARPDAPPTARVAAAPPSPPPPYVEASAEAATVTSAEAATVTRAARTTRRRNLLLIDRLEAEPKSPEKAPRAGFGDPVSKARAREARHRTARWFALTPPSSSLLLWYFSPFSSPRAPRAWTRACGCARGGRGRRRRAKALEGFARRATPTRRALLAEPSAAREVPSNAPAAIPSRPSDEKEKKKPSKSRRPPGFELASSRL